MTDEERKELGARIRAFENEIDELLKTIQPTRDKILAIDGAKEELLAKHNVEIAEWCEGCGAVLFVGEQGHVCADGPVLCPACAPTYADVRAHWEKKTAPEYAEERQSSLAAFDAHVAGGGSLEDKATWTL